jgi:hypothetical protein
MKVRRQSGEGNGRSIFTLVLVVIIFAGVFFAVNISKAKVEADSLKITGLYGITLKYEDINEVSLKENLPKDMRRTNGIDFFGAFIGKFKAEGMDNLKLFVKSKKEPFIYLTTKNNGHVIINTKEKSETEVLYNNINSKVKR